MKSVIMESNINKFALMVVSLFIQIHNIISSRQGNMDIRELSFICDVRLATASWFSISTGVTNTHGNTC